MSKKAESYSWKYAFLLLLGFFLGLLMAAALKPGKSHSLSACLAMAAAAAILAGHALLRERRRKAQYADLEKTLRDGQAHLQQSLTRQAAELQKCQNLLADEKADRQAAEEKLEKAAEELHRSAKELDDFAHAAYHDLQEPLRSIASHLQLLQKRYQGNLDSDADDFIGFAVQGAQRMKEVIMDLLAYARISHHGRTLRPADSSVILDHALGSLRESLKETGATIDQAPLPLVMADSLQISQVFQNLIGNALKFRREDAPQIKIAAWKEDGQWIFSIADNGIGIDPQYHEQIFSLFNRLHGPAAYPGTGIGLPICRKIIERHGGRIWLDSVPGKGSTFYFALPAADTNP